MEREGVVTEAVVASPRVAIGAAALASGAERGAAATKLTKPAAPVEAPTQPVLAAVELEEAGQSGAVAAASAVPKTSSTLVGKAFLKQPKFPTRGIPFRACATPPRQRPQLRSSPAESPARHRGPRVKVPAIPVPAKVKKTYKTMSKTM